MLLVFASVIALGINVIAQIVVCQMTRGKKIYLTILCGLAVGLVAVTTFTILATKHNREMEPYDDYAYLIFNVLCYVSLSYGYFQFVGLNVTSLRIRIAKELLAAGGRKPIEALLGEYNADEVIDVRLHRLIDSEQLALKDGRYFSGRKVFFLTIGKIVDTLRYIVLGKRPRVK